MKVKELIKQLEQVNGDIQIIFSSDEELNTLRSEGEVAFDEEENVVYIYGFDGTEVEE